MKKFKKSKGSRLRMEDNENEEVSDDDQNCENQSPIEFAIP